MSWTATGLFVVGTLVIAAISWGGSIAMFIDVPSMLIVTGIVGGGTLVSFSPRRIRQMLRADGEEGVGLRAAVFDRMADLSIAAGTLGSLIGFVKMLSSLSDPSSIGPAMAVALLTLFYGVVLGEVVFRGLARATPAAAGPRMGRRGAVYLPLAVLSVLVSLFLLMLVSLADFSF